jgi:signal transduction histidine kinase
LISKLYLLIILYLFINCKSSPPQVIEVRDGEVKIEDSFFQNAGMNHLNGLWKFQLKRQNQVLITNTIPVPDKWQNYFPEEEYSARDVIGEYRVVILNKNENIGLLIPYQKHSQEATLNGVIIQTNIDKFSKFKGNFHPSPFPLPVGQSELVIKITNLEGNHTRTGIRFPILIGNLEELNQFNMRKHFGNFFLSCFILGVGLYHFLFFLNYKIEKIQLYFSFFCIAVSLYSLLISNEFENFIPQFDTSIHIKLEFFLEVSFFLIFSKFLDTLFPSLKKFPWERVARWVAYVTLLLIIILDIHTISNVYSYSNYVFFFLGAEAVSRFFRAYRQRLKDSQTLVVLGSILGIFMFNDIIYGITERFFIVPYSFPYGLIFFIIAYSYLISKHFTESYIKAKELVVLQEKYNEQIIASSNQKLKIASELHDKIGADLSYLVLEATQLKEKYPPLGEFSNLLKSDLESIRDYVYLLTSEKINSQILEEELEKYLSRLKSSKIIEIDYKIIEISDLLNADTSLNLQRIFSEIMTNIMRHSRPKSLYFSTYKNRSRLGFIISHNGERFQWKSGEKKETSGMGLRSIEDRLRKIHGSCKMFQHLGTNYAILSLRHKPRIG